MIVRFKKNWRWAEKGIFVRDFKVDREYTEAGRCSETEIMPEAAALAIDLGVAEEVSKARPPHKPEGKLQEDDGGKKPSSGKSGRPGKGKRSR